MTNPTTQEPTRIPPVTQDPAFTKAQATQAQFEADTQRIRDDVRLSKLAQAEHITQRWNETNAELASLRGDFNARRQDRGEWLTRQLPIGPGVPEATSAGDRATLTAAFRAAYSQAFAASPDERAAMLTEAARFGDEPAVRAAITASLDNGEVQTVKAWAARHAPDTAAVLDELTALRDTAMLADLHARQAFG